MESRLTIFELNRLLDQLDGLIVLASLVGDDAKQVEGLGLIRLSRKDASVHSFGRVEPPGLVMRESQRQSFGKSGHNLGCPLDCPARF